MRMLIPVVLLVGCRQPIPPRPQQLAVIRAPSDITVDIAPNGAVAWVVTAHNNRDDTVKLLWDESSFVDSNGRSYGRLIRGQTRVMDQTRPQMPSVMAPPATIQEFVVPESPPEWKTDPTNNTGSGPLPAAVTKGVGRMYVVFESDKKETWEGALSFDGSALPQPRVPAPSIDAGVSSDGAP